MRAYVDEYRRFHKDTNEWSHKISQEGYDTIEAAQRFIEGRAGNPVKCSMYYYQTAQFEEYYIHEVIIKEAKKT